MESRTEASLIVMAAVKKCRVDPHHDHWVYECPDVEGALVRFGELKVAEGYLECARSFQCDHGLPGRCLSCAPCRRVKKAEGRVIALREDGARV